MYVELTCKSNFSFLRGASDSREYILQAQALGMTALGICDVNGVYALPRAYEAIRDQAPEVNLICGASITMQAPHPPLTLLAKTRQGYGLLCRLLTETHRGKEKGQGFLTFSQLIFYIENFPAGADLFCLCPPNSSFSLLKEIFGENLYLLVCRYQDGKDRERTATALQIRADYEIPFVASNDVHYHLPERRPLQDALTCVREGVSLDEAGFRLFANGERYLKSPQEMAQLFHDLPEAIHNTMKIAEACRFQLTELRYTYPQEFIPPGFTAASYLRQVVSAGAQKLYRGAIPPAAQKQIETELDFFAQRDLEHYFLTMYDIVRFAESRDIICQGRGSAANSIVCYVLGITSIDPIKNHLLFDRFMNEGRNDPPDIDVDFEHERREEVIQYIYERFGRDRAAMVAAVPTYRRKGAFRELSKALGIDGGTMSTGELENRFEDVAGELSPRRALLDELVTQVKGFPRHLSIHSGGFVLSDTPLIEMVPVEPARMEGRTVIQWDKQDLETLGLMKVDILSIGFLTVLHKATALAGIDWKRIPYDHKPTYQMIQRAETHGTFQIESRAQMAMLVQTLPENYYDLVIEVALVRPSPTEGGMVRPYLKNRALLRKGIPWRIGHAGLEKILQRTCGVPIFQEQIMQIAIEVAHFSASEADQLRRTLAFQRSADSIESTGVRFYQALLRNGVSRDFADKLFKYVKGYAHYGFPEAHAASYASLAYKSAYMKCQHPAELLCGLINSQPMGFYSVDTLLQEAQRNGVKVLPLHPNKSEWDATLEAPRTVRMGFRHVRKVRKEDILQMREEVRWREFDSIEDFIARTCFNREALENLAKADAFSVFALDRRHAFWKSLEFINLLSIREELSGSLFNEKTRLPSAQGIFAPMSLLEEITLDYKTLGYSNHGQFMKGLRREYPQLPATTSAQVKALKRGDAVRYAGVLTALQCPPPAKGTAFITLEDELGSVDLVLRKEIYESHKKLIRYSSVLIIEGRLQRRGTGVSVLVAKVSSQKEFSSHRPTEHGETGRSLSPREGDFSSQS